MGTHWGQWEGMGPMGDMGAHGVPWGPMGGAWGSHVHVSASPTGRRGCELVALQTHDQSINETITNSDYFSFLDTYNVIPLYQSRCTDKCIYIYTHIYILRCICI